MQKHDIYVKNQGKESNMSRTETIKYQQGYSKKPVLPVCKNCKNFVFKWYHFDATWTKVWTKAPAYDATQARTSGYSYQRPSFQGCYRCGLGGFAIIRTASCSKFENRI